MLGDAELEVQGDADENKGFFENHIIATRETESEWLDCAPHRLDEAGWLFYFVHTNTVCMSH